MERLRNSRGGARGDPFRQWRTDQRVPMRSPVGLHRVGSGALSNRISKLETERAALMRARIIAIPLSILWLMSCKMPGEKQDFSKLTEEFVYSSLALSPVSATSAGYHEHNGVSLDEKLDDYS